MGKVRLTYEPGTVLEGLYREEKDRRLRWQDRALAAERALREVERLATPNADDTTLGAEVDREAIRNVARAALAHGDSDE